VVVVVGGVKLLPATLVNFSICLAICHIKLSFVLQPICFGGITPMISFFICYTNILRIYFIESLLTLISTDFVSLGEYFTMTQPYINNNINNTINFFIIEVF
jgi:hypothetical protein